MTWTNIPDASLDPNKPARSVDIKAIRDNIAHVRNSNSVVVFNSSGTYTKPNGIKAIRVTVVGAGGAGQNVENAINGQQYGTAGSGGGTAIKYILEAAIGVTETVTVGAGTTGSGGSSSFGSHCSAQGGVKGASEAGLMAKGVGGDFSLPGEQGYNNGGTNVQRGGSSYAGLGVNYTSPTGDSNGQAASANTGGGGGGASRATIGTSYGGAGGSGKVVIEEFY